MKPLTLVQLQQSCSSISYYHSYFGASFSGGSDFFLGGGALGTSAGINALGVGGVGGV